MLQKYYDISYSFFLGNNSYPLSPSPLYMLSSTIINDALSFLISTPQISTMVQLTPNTQVKSEMLQSKIHHVAYKSIIGTSPISHDVLAIVPSISVNPSTIVTKKDISESLKTTTKGNHSKLSPSYSISTLNIADDSNNPSTTYYATSTDFLANLSSKTHATHSFSTLSPSKSLVEFNVKNKSSKSWLNKTDNLISPTVSCINDISITLDSTVIITSSKTIPVSDSSIPTSDGSIFKPHIYHTEFHDTITTSSTTSTTISENKTITLKDTIHAPNVTAETNSESSNKTILTESKNSIKTMDNNLLGFSFNGGQQSLQQLTQDKDYIYYIVGTVAFGFICAIVMLLLLRKYK